MAPVTNEILGGTSAQESAPQSARAESKSNLRADAVSLEVPIKIHGSRAASVTNSQSERFEEQTTTMIVFPEGGVLRMATSVAPGQMLVLTNQKSRQDAICRVVKVRTFSASQSYVEVEFTRPQPAYWGVSFASQGQPDSGTAGTGALPKASIDSLPATHAAALPEPPAPELIENIVDLHGTKHGPLPLPTPPAKLASPFASIGTQEKIQPAAASTARPAASKSVAPATVRDSISTTPVPTPVSERVPAGSVANINSLPELDEVAAAAKAAPASDSFGIRLDSDLTSASAAPRQNWMVIAASIIVLLAVAAGGAWYFHSNFAKPVVPASAASAQNAVQNVQQPATSVRQEAPAQPVSGPASSVPSSGVLNASAEPENGKVGDGTRSPAKAASDATSKSQQQPHLTVESSSAPAPTAAAAAAQNAASSLLSDAAMKAHPLSSQRGTSSPGDAPVLTVGTESSHEVGYLPSIGSSGVAVPPPPAAAASQTPTPVHVGGTIRQPKLIHSVMPAYPFAAREANIQGDVVIDTRIGPNGSVANMKVISGPAMLRSAALDALRHWKYQPSELDGKPVAVQMLVTIRFRL
ncbi:MAG TPA: energy transducer TonB [Candidatus Acidoferrum sp.]|nr:energy transducer TonB [Candidatus Acidoferrum sp.]